MAIVFLVLILFFMFLCALAAGTETAFTSASLPWMRDKAAQGDDRARRAVSYMENPELYLVTALMNNNLWNVTLVTVAQIAIGTYIVETEWFKAAVVALGGSMETHWSELITSVVMTILCLVFAEILPKAVARNCANQWALKIVPILEASDRLLRFFIPISLITGASSRIVRLFGGDQKAEASVSREDLKFMVKTMKAQKIIDTDQARWLEETLEMDMRPVTSLMVPLATLCSLPETATVGEAEDLTAASRFINLPVYRERVDNIVGMVNLREIAADLPGLPGEADRARPISGWIHYDPLIVPESILLAKLWEKFSAAGKSMAFVVNEFGGVVGMVTFEDLVLSMGGRLENNRERIVNSHYRRIDSHTIECSGQMEIGSLENIAGRNIPDGRYTTVAGFILQLSEGLPSEGDHVQAVGLDFEVRSMANRGIGLVRISGIPEAASPAS